MLIARSRVKCSSGGVSRVWCLVGRLRSVSKPKTENSNVFSSFKDCEISTCTVQVVLVSVRANQISRLLGSKSSDEPGKKNVEKKKKKTGSANFAEIGCS